MSLSTSNIEIPYGSPKHTQLLNAFKTRLKLARSGISQRSQKWKENEDMLKAYMPASENDELRKAARKAGQPNYTTIEVPYSYAVMLTLHTYLTSIFMSRSPIIQVNGRHGESQQAEQCIEALLDYQVGVGGAMPIFYVWLLDPLRYGHGVLGHYWDEEMISTTVEVEEPVTFLGIEIPGRKPKKVRTTQQVKGYCGTKFYNVRPQDFLFDARVPLMHFQDGEFVIRFTQLGWNRAVERKAAGQYFNMEEARASHTHADYRDMGSSQTHLPNNGWLDTQLFDVDTKNPAILNLHEFYFELIPSEYGLSQSDLPEKWVFTVANERVIIGAQPLNFLHNKWPFDVLEYEIGGYELYNRSTLEITKTLNDTITWLFNSHFYNVRKTLNDQFVVDPSMIEMRDMEDPNPGRLIRLKPAAYGKPVDAFVKQFQTVDVTRSNMSDTEAVSQLMQRVTGATDNIMGQVNSSGRKTATEVRGSTEFGIGRLKTVAEWWGCTGWSPMTQKVIQTTQQMYDQERKYRICGDLSQWGERYLNVTPDDIAGFYDFVPVDGTLPIDRFAQANLWQQIMAGLYKAPDLMAQYDMPKMFAFVAQLAGLKNISQFKIQVTPDMQMQQSIAAGNSVPIAEGHAVEPGQIAGLGPPGQRRNKLPPIAELKAQVAELQVKLANAEAMVKEAYAKGMQASREFDEEMDTFLINFLRKPYSHIVIFAVALGLVVAGARIGAWLS